MLRLQAVQNNALIWATGIRWPDPRPTVEQLHNIHGIEAMNVRLHRLAAQTWARLADQGGTTYDSILAQHQVTQNEHRWWLRSLTRAEAETREPICTRRRAHLINYEDDEDE